MKTMPLAKLVLDWNLYPRHDVDSFQVSRLREAIQAGEELPPIMADSEGLRIIDGFHRYHAYSREKVERVPVELRSFGSDGERLLAAVEANARHGVALGPQDQGRVFELGEDLKIERETLAKAMAIRPETLGKIERKFGRTRRRQPFYLKPSVRHFAGREVPKAVQEVHDSLGGNDAEFYAQQLLMLIRSDGINMTERMAGLLDELRRAIDELKVAA